MIHVLFLSVKPLLYSSHVAKAVEVVVCTIIIMLLLVVYHAASLYLLTMNPYILLLT